MEYKNNLINYLLSEDNIQYLIDMIMKNLTIGQSSKAKCKKLIIEMMTKNINNLNVNPKNETEIVELIATINRQCYVDFSIYLTNKFPNKNLHKNNPESVHIEQKPIFQSNSNLIILTEDEKNKLLEQNGMNPHTSSAMSSDLFLEYLTNPSVLQMFQLMINQINQFNPQSTINNHIKVDMVMTEDEVYEILQNNLEKTQTNDKLKISNKNKSDKNKLAQNKSDKNKHSKNKLSKNTPDKNTPSKNTPDKNKSDKNNKLHSNNIQTHRSILTEEKFDSSEEQSEEFHDLNLSNKVSESSSSDRSVEESNDMDGSEEISNNSSESDSLDNEFDLSKGLTGEILLRIEQRIKDIVALKTSYLSKKNNSNSDDIDEKINTLDEEKNRLLASVIECRNNSEKSAKENKNKINTLSTSSRPVDPDPNVEYLDLKLDPSNDYNDSKNIIIKIKSENKISEILLVDYYIPFNANNVNRFNNIFSIYMEERAYRIIIPPSKYSIQTLLNYIKSQINFLDFNIDNSSNIITITNNMNAKFDLMLGDDTIFQMLGFNHKSNTYKDKMAYSGSEKYNAECNEKIFFGLSGTSMEPLLLEFDKKITSNTILKKIRSGFNLKQLNLRFTNSLDQFYDFIMPINICIKITYTNKS